MTVQLRRLLYFLIWFDIAACSGDFTKPNKVVLVFQDWSEEDSFVDQVSRVKYVDDCLIPHVFKPGERERVKHIISTSREYRRCHGIRGADDQTWERTTAGK